MMGTGKRGAGSRDRWSGSTTEERWCEYKNLIQRGLHRHIHVHANCQSTVFVAPKAGALHSHLCLGTHPLTHTHMHTQTQTHTHTQSWLM